MFQPKRILLPTDLSELSLSVFPWAVSFAEGFDATIVLLYADSFADPIDLVGGGFAVSDPERADSMKDLARRTLEGHATNLLPETLHREIVIDVDAPYRSIVRHAESADLVIMGTHGRTGWRRALLGSVTETVLRETTTPVLAIRGAEEEGQAPAPRFSRIVCPVNYTEMALLALSHAVDVASVFDSEIVLVHVVEDRTGSGSGHAEQLEAWIPSEVARRMKSRKLVLKGDPAEEVIDLARKESADLIVVGAQHKRFSDATVVGVTTERITRHAACPVLTVHREESSES
jgi:nucleotide-binding universal stress UspA family protein